MTYVITCYTHLSALLTCRSLKEHGMEAQMAPVPRKLSSSCGTCVYCQTEQLDCTLLDGDTEAVYLCGEKETYQKLDI